MTIDEKEKFISDLTTAIKDQLLRNVHRVPESWDGFELRQWIADTTVYEVGEAIQTDRKRFKNYKNDVLINGL